MENPPNLERKILSLEDIRHFIVDEQGNAEVIEEGKNKLVIKQGDKIIKIWMGDPETEENK